MHIYQAPPNFLGQLLYKSIFNLRSQYRNDARWSSFIRNIKLSFQIHWKQYEYCDIIFAVDRFMREWLIHFSRKRDQTLEFRISSSIIQYWHAGQTWYRNYTISREISLVHGNMKRLILRKAGIESVNELGWRRARVRRHRN